MWKWEWEPEHEREAEVQNCMGDENTALSESTVKATLEV